MRRLKDLILREETKRGCKLGHLRREFNTSVRQGAPTSALLRLAGGLQRTYIWNLLMEHPILTHTKF